MAFQANASRAWIPGTGLRNLAQPHLLRATQRFAFFRGGQRLIPKARQCVVKLCVEIEIRVCGVHVRE